MSVNAYPSERGLTVYFTDITEERKQAIQIEEKNKNLREIAWMLSHEFRKPVATILGLVQLFDPAADGETKKLVKGINQAAEELDKIIKDADSKTQSEELL